MDPLWYLIALLAWIALGLWAYGEIENRLDPEYGPELPDGWDTQILRVGFWWTAEGYYVGPEFAEPELVVSGRTLTRKSAVEQVALWIDEARTMPEEWMPEVQP